MSVRALFTALLVLAAILPAAGEPARPPQFVLVSFDGARDIAQWERARAMARATGARFTFFLSCATLLTKQTRDAYRGPEGARSNVGWAASRDDVAARLREIWAARGEGHEIASHGCGHLDGGRWSAAQWSREFGEFHRLVGEAWAINAIPYEPSGWRRFVAGEITGFRAPYLSTGAGFEEALRRSGLSYDASGVARDPAAPAEKAGMARFALPMLPEGPQGRRIIAMDYNLFVRHSGGFERADAAGAFERRTRAMLDDAFAAAYDGDRPPLQFGLHFTLMNGGAYWRAVEGFLADICGRPEVRCTTYRDYLAASARRPS